MRTAVVGTGYVGLVTGTCLAEIGNHVVCHDTDAARITRLTEGAMPFYEPELEELVRRNTRDGRLRFTNRLDEAVRDAAIAFVAVGTPAGATGEADDRGVREAVGAIARATTGPLVIAVKSTVPTGACAALQASVREGVQVISNPEFLREGRAVDDFLRPDRIVVGAETPAGHDAMRELYRHFIRNGHTYLEMDTRSAELTKYAANAMLATRISLMNELAQLCEHLGADIMQVRLGVGADQRIGMAYLYPGAGWGGSCFPKDVRALAHAAAAAELPADILAAVARVNEVQREELAARVLAKLGGRGITGVWGLAFKPKTDDVREAPALTIIERLTAAGVEVRAYDPEAMANAERALRGNARVSFASTPEAAADGADAVVLITEWPIFRGLDLGEVKSRMRRPLFFDGRNLYEPARMAALGFDYHCIGRRSR
jgi:UDPglucose 6-dehydrogenase